MVVGAKASITGSLCQVSFVQIDPVLEEIYVKTCNKLITAAYIVSFNSVRPTVRFRRGRKFVVLVVGGRAAS